MIKETFNQADYKLIIEALWKRQRCYIAGDRMFKKFESLIKEMEELKDACVS